MGAWFTEYPDLVLSGSESGSYTIVGPIEADGMIGLWISDGIDSGGFGMNFPVGEPDSSEFPLDSSTKYGTLAYDGNRTLTITLRNYPSPHEVSIDYVNYYLSDGETEEMARTITSGTAYAYQLPSLPKNGLPMDVEVSGHHYNFVGGQPLDYQIGSVFDGVYGAVWYDGIDTIGYAASSNYSIVAGNIAYVPVAGANSYGFYADKSKAPIGEDIGVTCAVLLEDESVPGNGSTLLRLKIPVPENSNEKIIPIGVAGIQLGAPLNTMLLLDLFTGYYYIETQLDEDGYMTMVVWVGNQDSSASSLGTVHTRARVSFIKR